MPANGCWPATASFRKYFRLTRPAAPPSVMDAPAPQEDVARSCAIGRHLLAMGLSAPRDPGSRRDQRLPAAGGPRRRHLRAHAGPWRRTRRSLRPRH
jgi:hypothetical protein